ncbi:MAG: hypothetical protein D6761_10205 [Candidatus Dadabacteria bacterium]|nr:MAG: hypothetical protein D6761_10205 [Candidatus Dadabacteria bacterium]
MAGLAVGERQQQVGTILADNWRCRHPECWDSTEILFAEGPVAIYVDGDPVTDVAGYFGDAYPVTLEVYASDSGGHLLGFHAAAPTSRPVSGFYFDLELRED